MTDPKTIRITETLLRDAHQSQVATRMTTAQMLPLLETLDACGYHSLEVWGGATFDTCLRYLNEDPWERLRILKKHLKKTPLQMLLRGQSLLGYKHYSDDVVSAFIQKAIENGIDIIRCFDALNDLRNLQVCVSAIHKYKGHAQLAICFATSPVHTDDYYCQLALDMEAMGADSIVIKDMSGILTPARAATLVKRLKTCLTCPLHIHSHATSGTASMMYLKAIEAGADGIDTALSAFAGGTSQPATETMACTLQEFNYHHTLNLDKVTRANHTCLNLKAHFRSLDLYNPRLMETDPRVLYNQVPGGMLSNLMAQLEAMNLSHLYDAVLEEIPHVRHDLGYPPLVTPLSQMVGTQALMNVLSKEGRYAMIPDEIRQYVLGHYGQSPTPIDPNLQKHIIQDKTPLTTRPADHLKPQLEDAKKTYANVANSLENVLSCILFPDIAISFLQQKTNQSIQIIRIECA